MKSTTNIKGAMQVELPIKIYGYDIDVMGIVHNIVYIKWFEHLRQEFLDQYWPLEHMLQQDQSPILQKTQVEYKKPLTIYDKPTGILWVSKIKRVRWAVDIEIVQNGQIYCTGQQSGFFYDLKEKQPVLMPKALVNMYEQFQEENQK
ncbi:MAG: acyl-CoA thioesterase [Bacteroidales bacterium]|nr:acyl-CoA thioesterase [Bacteroidales bacterium]MCF8336393.1 acyl-CoA thioesterase [Bacteroidales bacterium]